MSCRGRDSPHEIPPCWVRVAPGLVSFFFWLRSQQFLSVLRSIEQIAPFFARWVHCMCSRKRQKYGSLSGFRDRNEYRYQSVASILGSSSRARRHGTGPRQVIARVDCSTTDAQRLSVLHRRIMLKSDQEPENKAVRSGDGLTKLGHNGSSSAHESKSTQTVHGLARTLEEYIEHTSRSRIDSRSGSNVVEGTQPPSQHGFTKGNTASRHSTRR